MKLKRAFVGVAAALIAVLPMTMSAQQGMMAQQPLPIDSVVHVETLPNGLTIIVRHNANPQHRADYYIAQKVGSILEDDNQAGLAHFLEHMAFNGTKNFPGKNLISFLERIGCKFGADLNAYTAFDETVYTIMDAPTTDKKVVDSCLLIMHDWSNNITLDGKEIDEERGVIHEEWRMRNNAMIRMFTAIMPKLLPGNKYADRMPIGSMEVVDHAPYSALRDYYKKWYRPDQQGIIVVGDVDPVYVIAKLKEYFKDVPKPVNPAERYTVPVEDNDAPLVGIATDTEATSTDLQIMYKFEPIPRELRGTISGFVYNYMTQAITQMANYRFAEILQKPNAPFLSAGMYIGEYMGIAKTKDAVTFMARAREGEAVKAMNALVAEVERIRQFGFTKSEYDMVRTNVIKSYEDSYKERDKQKTRDLIEEYKNYFLDGGYIPGIAAEYEMVKQIAPSIPVEAINQTLQQFITEKNIGIMLMGPKKDGITYPSEDQLRADFIAATKQKVEAYKEQVSDTKLVDKAPKSGKIVSEKKNQKYGATELTLSNGVKVYLKNTDYKDDEIQMTGIKPGGAYLYGKGDYDNLKVLNAAMSVGGLGKFDAIALSKALTGRTASMNASIGGAEDVISGASTKEDFETMMQLVYLQFTAQRTDKDAYEAFMQKRIEALKNAKANPMSSLQDSVSKLLFGDNPYRQPLKEQDFKAISYDRIMQIARERFGNAAGMKFFFVGNIDEAKMKPIIAQWLGALPANAKTAVAKAPYDKTPAILKGKAEIDYTKDLDTPVAHMFDMISGDMEYNQRNAMVMEILSGILDQVYTASIREREGGAYSVMANADIDEYPQGISSIQVYFPTDPKRANDMNKIVFRELEKIAKEGPNKVHFDKTVLNMEKVHAENLRKNNYWNGRMLQFYTYNRDWDSNWESTLKGITTADVQKAVQDLLKQGNVRTLVLRSTKTEQDKKAAK